MLLASLVLGGCGDHPASPGRHPEPRARLAAQLGGSAEHISGVALHVTGREIPEPLVFHLGRPDSLGRTAPVDVVLPAGPARVFQAYAYTRDTRTHAGADTLDVTTSGLAVRVDLRKFPDSDTIYTDPPRDFTIKMDDAATFQADVDSTTVPPGGRLALSVQMSAGSTLASLGLTEGDPVPDTPVSWGADDAERVRLSDWVCVTGGTLSPAPGECGVTVFVAASTPPGSRITVFVSSGGVADRMVLRVE